MLWQGIQVPLESPLLRCGPGSSVLLAGLYAGNTQQLSGSAWLHTGSKWRRVEMFLLQLNGHVRHLTLLVTVVSPAFPPPLPFPPLSMGKILQGMGCCAVENDIC